MVKTKQMHRAGTVIVLGKRLRGGQRQLCRVYAPVALLPMREFLHVLGGLRVFPLQVPEHRRRRSRRHPARAAPQVARRLPTGLSTEPTPTPDM